MMAPIAWLGGLITAAAALIGGIATLRSAKGAGSKTAVETMQIVMDSMRKDLDDVRTRAKDLEDDAEAQRDHSARQDQAINRLQDELARALHHVREVWAWIDSGAQPPPPTKPPWLIARHDQADRDTP